MLYKISFLISVFFRYWIFCTLLLTQSFAANEWWQKWQLDGNWKKFLSRGYTPEPKDFIAVIHFHNEEALTTLTSTPEGRKQALEVIPADQVPSEFCKDLPDSLTPLHFACLSEFWEQADFLSSFLLSDTSLNVSGFTDVLLKILPSLRKSSRYTVATVSVVYALLTQRDNVNDIIKRANQCFTHEDFLIARNVFDYATPHNLNRTLWHSILESNDPELWERSRIPTKTSVTDWFNKTFKLTLQNSLALKLLEDSSGTEIDTSTEIPCKSADILKEIEVNPAYYVLFINHSNILFDRETQLIQNPLLKYWIDLDCRQENSILIDGDFFSPLSAAIIDVQHKRIHPLFQLLHYIGSSVISQSVFHDLFDLLAYFSRPGKENTLQKLLNLRSSTFIHSFGKATQDTFILSEYAYFCRQEKSENSELERFHYSLCRFELERLHFPKCWEHLKNQTLEDEIRTRITAIPVLYSFLYTLESTLNQVMGGHWIIKSGMVQRVDPEGTASTIANGITILGDLIPFPGASTVAKLASLGLRTYQNMEASRQTKHATKTFTSLTGIETIMSSLSLVITDIYQEPIVEFLNQETSSVFASYVSKSVLTFFTDYAPLEELSLAENISLLLSFANRDENVISKLSRQFIPRIFSKTMLSLNDGTKIEVIEFLQGIGIKFGEEDYIFCSESEDADIPASKPPFGYKRALNKKEIEFLKLKKVGEINPMQSTASQHTNMPQRDIPGVMERTRDVIIDIAPDVVSSVIGESNIEKIKSSLISEASGIVKTAEDTIEDSITVSNLPSGKKRLKCSWCSIL